VSEARSLDEYVAQASAALAAGDLVTATEAGRRGTPIHGRMGLTIVRADAEAAVLTMEVTDEVRGAAPGSVHGGLLATFADASCAIALRGSYDTGVHIPVTTDMHIRYYRQPQAGPLTATAQVVHRGRRLLSTESVIVDAHDRVLARSTATYMLVPFPS
jgi:uncharacterized protein (TIGR00369 family)